MKFLWLINGWTPLFVACCISCIVAIRVFRFVQRRDSDTRNDVTLRTLWFLMLGTLAWYSWLLDSLSSYFDTISFFSSTELYSSTVTASVIGLVCLSITVFNPHHSDRSRRTIEYLTVGMLVGIFCLVCMDKINGHSFNLLAVYNWQLVSSRFIKVAPVNDELISAVCLSGILLFFLAAGIRSPEPSRRRSTGSLIALLVGMSLAIYVECLLIPNNYPFIQEALFACNLSRFALAILVSSVLGVAYGWRQTIRDCCPCERDETSSPDKLGWLEFSAVLGLFASSCFALYYDAFDYENPWMIDLNQLTGYEFFLLALPIVCSGFALGRWISMHWSSGIVEPVTIYRDVPIFKFFRESLIAQSWLLAFSVLAAWAMSRPQIWILIADLWPS